MFDKPWEPLPHADTVTDLLARRAPVGSHPCVRSGCTAAATWRCNYRDTSGDRCDTFVCPEHGHEVAEVLFCARHARIVELLLRTEGTLFEIKGIPSVGDRSLVLVDEIAQLVDQPIIELLRRRFVSRPEVRIAADLGVRPFGRGRRPLGWESGWSVVAEQGFQSRVTLRVYTTRPQTVFALVDDLPVFQGVPGWVRSENRRPRSVKSETGFRDAVLEAIEKELFPPTDVD
jgi:hypothetical protein